MTDNDDVGLIGRLRDLLADVALDEATLPSEPALASSLGTSRPALREALTRLEAEGLVSRRQGAGTTVNRLGHSIPARFDQQVDFVDVIARTGRTPSIDVLEAGRVTLSAETCALLAKPTGQAGYRTVKRWNADGAPVMVAVDEIAVDGDGWAELLDADAAVFDNAAAISGRSVEWEIARPTAVTAKREAARWFGAPGGTPLLVLDLVGVSRTGEPLYRALEYHRPGAIDFGFVRTVR